MKIQDYAGAKKQFVETVILISHTNTKSAKIMSVKYKGKTLLSCFDLRGVARVYLTWQPVMHWSAFPCQNFLEISIQTEMERFGPGGNLSCQSGPPPEVVLFDRPVQSDIAVPFSEIIVSSPAPACHHSQNGGWFRCKCLRVQCV